MILFFVLLLVIPIRRENLTESAVRHSTIHIPPNQFEYQSNLLDQSEQVRSSSPKRSKIPYVPTHRVPTSLFLKEYDLNAIFYLVEQLKSMNLECFDPIKMEVSIWFNNLEDKLIKLESMNMALSIAPHFLDKVSRNYFLILETNERYFNYELFKDRFVYKFSSFKSLKMREAFTYEYRGGSIFEYAKKKLELLEYVLPNLEEGDLIKACIAGFSTRHYINLFSKNINCNKSTFLKKIELHDARYVPSANLSAIDPILEDNIPHSNGNGNEDDEVTVVHDLNEQNENQSMFQNIFGFLRRQF